MALPLAVALAGIGIGVVFGLFGAGGSAFATPVLAMIGVPAPLALASPLPAMLPAAVLGARRYLRSGNLDVRTAQLAVLGGLPGAVVGAALSTVVGGSRLLVLSGAVLLVLGVRTVLPDGKDAVVRAAARRDQRTLVVGAAFAVGVCTGLLANGGGFLLVPLFVIVLGLSAPEAAGTSMVAAAALTIPTLLVHGALGHIDWTVAAAFGLGMMPGSQLGSRLHAVVPPVAARRVFGAVLVAFAAWFLVTTV